MSSEGAVLDAAEGSVIEHAAPAGKRRESARRRGWLSRVRRGRVPAAPVEIDAEVAVAKEPRAFPWKLLSFVFAVVLPFAASVYYYGWVASDQYESEARFVVRTISGGEVEETKDGEASSGGIISMSALTQDAYVVTSFIHSSDLLTRLSERFDWDAIYSHEAIDPLSRFDPKEGWEAFLDYWRGKATTFVDGPSGIVTLRVRAFDPEHARDLTAAVIEESEALVNELSERARRDLISRAVEEVRDGTQRYSLALAAMKQYQNQSGILEPTATAGATGELLTGLLAQRLEIEGKLDVLENGNNVDSPNYRQLTRARATLSNQIAELQSTLASAGRDETISAALVQFSRLETDRLLAEKLYELARKNLESLRQAAIRKAAYIGTFAEPLTADAPSYPRRFVTPLLILIGLMVAWATALLAFATVEDHRS